MLSLVVNFLLKKKMQITTLLPISQEVLTNPVSVNGSSNLAINIFSQNNLS